MTLITHFPTTISSFGHLGFQSLFYEMFANQDLGCTSGKQSPKDACHYWIPIIFAAEFT